MLELCVDTDVAGTVVACVVVGWTVLKVCGDDTELLVGCPVLELCVATDDVAGTVVA